MLELLKRNHQRLAINKQIYKAQKANPIRITAIVADIALIFLKNNDDDNNNPKN